MSENFNLELFFANLAFNLILFGSVIALCVGIGLRLIKNAAPRLRYILTVAAFMIASIVPLVLTFGGSVNLGRFTEDKSVEVEVTSEDFFIRENSLDDRNLFTIPTNEKKTI